MSDYGVDSLAGIQPDFEKGPYDTLDFPFNWKPELNGDTIFTSSFSLPDGLALVSQTNTSTTATPFLSGGTSGSVYRVVNTIVTVGGRTRSKTMYLLVKDGL